jgi:hypothetical protein
MTTVTGITDKWQLSCAYDPDTKEIRPLIRGDSTWKVQRFEYSSGDMIYKGVHETLGAATSDWGWRIWKFTWDMNGNPAMIEGPVLGPWDDRASLGWE